MAELWFRRGLNPDDPSEFVLAIVIDPDGEWGDRAALQLWDYAHDGDGVTHLLRTDGWAEQSLDGDVLTVDLVVYPSVLRNLGLDETGFSERSPIEPEAVRLLRVSASVDTVEYQRTPVLAAVVHSPVGTTSEQMLAKISDGEVWPLIIAPPPGHDPW
jgi:hypothetical protein